MLDWGNRNKTPKKLESQKFGTRFRKFRSKKIGTFGLFQISKHSRNTTISPFQIIFVIWYTHCYIYLDFILSILIRLFVVVVP